MKKFFCFLGIAVFLLTCVCTCQWLMINGADSGSAGVLAGEEFEGDDVDMDFEAGGETWAEADTQSSGTEDGTGAESDSGEAAPERTSSAYSDRVRGAAKDTSKTWRYEADTQDKEVQEDAAHRETGYIFMGDSRFYLMNQDCGIDTRKNFFVVACPGMGYSWMIVEALPEITSIRNAHPEIGNWVIISGLGVNDMENVQSYLDTYKVLAKNMSLVLLSVNPVSGPVEKGYGNGTIDAFNDRLKSLATRESSIKYINCHDYLVHKGYTTIDGIHYDVATNYDIYLFILNSLNLNG